MEEMMKKLFPEIYKGTAEESSNGGKEVFQNSTTKIVDSKNSSGMQSIKIYSPKKKNPPPSKLYVINTKMDKDCLKCSKCDRECRSVAGRKTHEKARKAQKNKDVLQPPTSYEEKNSAFVSMTSHGEDGENLQHKALVWGNHTCYDLTQVISAVYEEMTKWRKNIFKVPSGAAGKKCVEETTRLIT